VAGELARSPVPGRSGTEHRKGVATSERPNRVGRLARVWPVQATAVGSSLIVQVAGSRRWPGLSRCGNRMSYPCRASPRLATLPGSSVRTTRRAAPRRGTHRPRPAPAPAHKVAPRKLSRAAATSSGCAVRCSRYRCRAPAAPCTRTRAGVRVPVFAELGRGVVAPGARAIADAEIPANGTLISSGMDRWITLCARKVERAIDILQAAARPRGKAGKEN
jgi:hypothetical protein